MNSAPATLIDPSEKSHFGTIILTFCSLSALLIFLVYSKNFVFGSEIGKWTYKYFDKVPSVPLWIPVAAITLLGLTVFIGSRLIHRHEKATLLVCFFLAVFLQILIFNAYPYTLDTIVKSDRDTGYYSQAMLYSPLEFLSQYSSLAPSLPLHATTNMPGKMLLFQLFELFTTSPGIIAYLIVVLSTLGAPLLYAICLHLFHDRLTGFFAFILYALIPSKLFFLPILNSVTPVFILLCFYLFLVYLERKKTWALGLLGFVLYLTILFEPSPLVTGLIFLGVLAFYFAQKKLVKKEIMLIGMIPVAAFLGTYLFFSLVFSFDLRQALSYVLNEISNFNLYVRPNYAVWLGEDFKEFSYVVGLPVMMITVYQAVQIFTEGRSLKSIFKEWSIEKAYLVSLLFTFATLLLLGIIRGEVTRLWIYLAVFFQIPAAFFMGKVIKSNLLFFLVASVLAVQALVTLHRVAFLVP